MAAGPGPPHRMTVLEQCHVSPAPAPAAGQPRALPLAFFDLVFWGFPPVGPCSVYSSTTTRTSSTSPTSCLASCHGSKRPSPLPYTTCILWPGS
ncbi:hypothetical protein U9M48_021644 [Paspalum notatum var. saurae]|uniref:Uncharacterized protein n=1 Tax=Paspalum notatum var. saurae TaxID=547442 RepID=A0AAQ3TI06_PASNO